MRRLEEEEHKTKQDLSFKIRSATKIMFVKTKQKKKTGRYFFLKKKDREVFLKKDRGGIS